MEGAGPPDETLSALTTRGKRSTVAVTAVTRELVGFMWTIALMEPTEA